MPTTEALDQTITKETISREPVQELEARLHSETLRLEHELRDKEVTARHQRFLEKVKVLTFMACALIAGLVCLYVSFSSGFQQEERKQASAIVQNILTGIVGFLAGKVTGKNNPV